MLHRRVGGLTPPEDTVLGFNGFSLQEKGRLFVSCAVEF